MLLAADVGGTKTLIGIFRATTPRPTLVHSCEFPTLDFQNLEDMAAACLAEAGVERVDAVCAGAAGPVLDGVAQLTNVPWAVDVTPTARRFGRGPAEVLNDLEATAYGITVLTTRELRVLQEGAQDPAANAAVIAAGTGLGEALLHNVNGCYVPAATEAGHADFAPRTTRQVELMLWVSERFGRASVEHIISGRGLVNISRFVHADTDGECAAMGRAIDESEIAAALSANALEHRCPRCREGLDIFVDAYGAEAGNLALRSVAKGGIFVGGGIAPKILPAIEEGSFMEAFRAKAPMADLLGTIRVSVVLNPETGLLGAAVRAASLARDADRS